MLALARMITEGSKHLSLRQVSIKRPISQSPPVEHKENCPQINTVSTRNINLGFEILNLMANMPPNPRIDNNTLVWNAVSKQLDIAEGFKGIWNRLDHDRLIADMGVANKNAAHHRFRRWISSMAEQSGQINPGNEDMGEAADNDESPVMAGKKSVKHLAKNRIAGKKGAAKTKIAKASLDTNEDDRKKIIKVED